MTHIDLLKKHQRELQACRKCKTMIAPVIVGQPILSDILLIGQAPGDREGAIGKPFAWTAGKTLFKWFAQIGLSEEQFRDKVYMSAVCRCFPGKNPKGGDRVPSKKEITCCAPWLNQEIEILHPKLIIPVGKLAISQYLDQKKLVDVIGQGFKKKINGQPLEIIPLPHPSGASTWHQSAPGKQLLQQALQRINKSYAWQSLLT